MNFTTSLLSIVTLALCASAGFAQSNTIDPGVTGLSRTELEALLSRYEEAGHSTAYSDAMRAQADAESALIRARLEEGDFQIGDQIALVVEGEPSLTNTFVVVAGPAIVLPEIGRIPLVGVLRSELESHVQRELARFIQRPVVHARSSIRVMVTGGVGQAGWYVLPTTALVTDALMEAGGPAAEADLTAIRVERHGETIWDGAALQTAIIEGRTLDQASLRAGDQIVVPVRESGAALRGITIVVPTILAVIGTLLQIF